MDGETQMWLKSVRGGVQQFLERMSEREFSYFKYTLSGDIKNSSFHWGLGNLVFATKILYITGLLDNISESKKKNLYENILKFCDKKGYITDPFVTTLQCKERIKNIILRKDKLVLKNNELSRRAETRQSFAALALLNRKPVKPFTYVPYTKKGVNKYLTDLNWTNPWSAGSHFSHLLFFLQMNTKLFDFKVDESRELIKYATEWIFNIQSENDGCWYKGEDVSLKERINGAMKILTGFHAVNRCDFPYAERLIDTCLSGVNDFEACSNFNIAYVIYGCSKVNPEYRKEEIKDFLLNRIRLFKGYYHNEGGFSFYKDKTNESYYGKIISLGKNEPDIHGTCMFVWGLAIINQVIDIGLDFRVPIN